MGDESLKSQLIGLLTSKYVHITHVEHRISSGMGDEPVPLKVLLISEDALFTLSVEHRISSGMGDESLKSQIIGLLTSKYVQFTLVEHRISSGMGDESLRSFLKGLLSSSNL